MAKRSAKNGEDNAREVDGPDQADSASSLPAARCSSPAVLDGVAMVLVECPVAVNPAAGYCGQDLGSVSSRHARMLARLTAGLKSDDQRLASGKPVATPNDAVVWMIEKIAANTPAGAT